MRDFSVLYHGAKNASSEAEHTESICCSQKHAVVSSSGLNSKKKKKRLEVRVMPGINFFHPVKKNFIFKTYLIRL